MTRHMDIYLDELHELLAVMAGYVEQAIEASTAAWKQRNIARTKDVYVIEDKVNQAHKKVDAECVKLLALQQPMASDLRLIVAIIKVNTDLERMVDLAVNIANTTEYYLKNPPLVQTVDLVQMTDKVRFMVREALDALVRNNKELAADVLSRDDFVDALKKKIIDEMLDSMKADSAVIEQALNVILIAKNLERIGDHATNIAEDVIFTISGDDVRHSYPPGKKNREAE